MVLIVDDDLHSIYDINIPKTSFIIVKKSHEMDTKWIKGIFVNET